MRHIKGAFSVILNEAHGKVSGREVKNLQRSFDLTLSFGEGRGEVSRFLYKVTKAEGVCAAHYAVKFDIEQ